MIEWQGDNEGERDIKIRLDLRQQAIKVFTGSDVRRPARTIDCKGCDKLYTKEAQDKKANMVLVRVPKDYDLVSLFGLFSR